MSERIVDNPELHGWVDLGDDKWGWDGQSGGGSSLWEQSGDDIYYDSGNVGIGNSDPQTAFVVQSNKDYTGNTPSSGSYTAAITSGTAILGLGQSDGRPAIQASGSGTGYNLVLNPNAGSVGIGMTPAVRTAKEQLAEWKSRASETSWTDVTDGEFSQEPTEELVAEWIETRAAGDKLQVAGNGSFSGTVSAGGETKVSTNKIWRTGYSGFQFTESIRPVDGNGAQTNGALSIGASDQQFKDAFFSGAVNAGSMNLRSARLYDTSDNGVGILFSPGASGAGGILPTDADGQLVNLGPSIGSDARRFNDGYFAGTVTAGAIVSLGNVTAYSSSDERLKENITPIPVGLIDDIKPVQWDWKEGGKSAGVVAQQLQAIGLDDFVREAPNGELGVDYNALVGVLLAEVIELKRQINDR